MAVTVAPAVRAPAVVAHPRLVAVSQLARPVPVSIGPTIAQWRATGFNFSQKSSIHRVVIATHPIWGARPLESVVSWPTPSPARTKEPAFWTMADRLLPTIQANGKNSMGNTFGGTRRKQVNVSGFRARRLSPGGRRVLQRRRAKGRWVLSPASERSRGKPKK